MPSTPSTPPVPPADPLLDDLPEFDETTDALELIVNLDPGAPEPIGQLGLEEEPDLLAEADEEWVLSTDEPAPSAWPEADRPQLGGFAEDDLEDFATQEELPILPWRIEVQLLELGVRLPAVLDPTCEHSIWERPDATGDPITATVRIRMLDIPITLTQVTAPESGLRLGRDVLAGRILIAAD